MDQPIIPERFQGKHTELKVVQAASESRMRVLSRMRVSRMRVLILL